MEKNKKIAICVSCVLFVVISGAIYMINRSIKEQKDQVIFNSIPRDSNEDAQEDAPVEQADTTIMVYITGEVKNPGVYEVLSGSRVNDVLEAAGGATEEANLKVVNLAAKVKDEEKIIVPNMSEEIDEARAEEESKSGLININTATKEELKTLPGIGDGIAGNIITYRENNGDFGSIEDIKKVPLIGAGRFAQIMDLITV